VLKKTTKPTSQPKDSKSTQPSPPLLDKQETKNTPKTHVPLATANSPSSQPQSGLPAPHSQFFPHSSPVDEKAQTLLSEVRGALDRAYPSSMIEHSDTRRAYLTQLAEYQSRSGSMNKAERDTLRQLLIILEDVAQRDAAQPSATSTTTMQNQ
jgi:hypothetical protein